MAWLEAREFYEQLQGPTSNPLVFLLGEEPYLIEQAMKQVEIQKVDDSMRDFNFTQYSASDAQIDKVRDNIETLPSFAHQRVIFLKDVHELKDSDWEVLEPLLSNPVSSTLLVMTASRFDKRKKVFKILSENAVCVEFKKLYDNQIPSWISYICQQQGLQISDEANHLLHRNVGSHLLEIEAEIIKLQSYISPKTRIDVDDVKAVVSKAREENVFQWTEAVASRDRVKALESLATLLEQGQNEVGVVSMMARHVRLLMKIKKGQQLGYNGSRLAQFVQVSPYFLANYIKQSSLWTQSQLENLILTLNETDLALKTSPVSAPLWLENMVLKMTHPKA